MMKDAIVKEKTGDLSLRELETPLQAGDLCPDCGQWAVEVRDGIKICGNCGEVVS